MILINSIDYLRGRVDGTSELIDTEIHCFKRDWAYSFGTTQDREEKRRRRRYIYRLLRQRSFYKRRLKSAIAELVSNSARSRVRQETKNANA